MQVSGTEASGCPSPAEERARLTELIVQSGSPKRLIVAGPGTGKTYMFQEALRATGKRGLALTFINNLARDLERDLAEVADSFTFHGFCKYHLHKIRVDGLSSRFHYYPPLLLIVAQDMELLGTSGINDREIERCLHNLDDEQGTVSGLISISNYYDAVGYTDSVYRVLRHLEINRGEIPDYPLVVVDEYQDFSLLETMFIRLLAEQSQVLIAGDDDQALYGFKHASANYIRELAHDAEFTKFSLPYCSRCTEVIVGAIHNVLGQAKSLGLLAERLTKPFQYYPPDKEEHSERYPQVIHAHCTVETNRARYMGRYVATRIGEITEEEILESQEGRYPTALVIGPPEFVRRIYPVVQDQFPNAILKESSTLAVSILDGYRYLQTDEDSRLGWRIILFCTSFGNAQEIVTKALESGAELGALVPPDFRAQHLGIARLIKKVMSAEALTGAEMESLESALDQPFETVRKRLQTDVDQEESESDNESNSTGDDLVPSIICTSLRGAKGLSANRVFIVGFNNGHFPRDPAAITDDEVCSLLVGLSRTRRQCYLVSCGRFGNSLLQQSIFLNWINSHLLTEKVDKNWILANASSSS